MTPLERLLAEELPTGDWGDGPARPAPASAPRSPRPEPASDPQAAAHRAALLAELADRDQRTRRHLYALPTPRSVA